VTARLSGKRCIVTGAASGIGRAAAELFAAEGARVLAADMEAAGLQETLSRIGAAGGDARSLVADVSDDRAVAALVEAAVRDLGGLDACFANAGVLGRVAPLLDLEPEDFSAVLRVNLLGAFSCIKHAARAMLGTGGSIVCTASVAGVRSGAGPAPYSAAKAALVNLVQVAANQLSRTGVRVNAIAPGLVETGMTRPLYEHARASGKEHKIGQLNPLGRGGEPREIAECALFLASDASSYVNGQLLVADGGLSSSLPFVPGKMM
jgi:NAD(P)-dependent dehydrogenase (short-subunit alcohol dehydrogenase family)